MPKLIAVKSEGSTELTKLLSAIPGDYEVVVASDMNAALKALRENGAEGLIADRKSFPAELEPVTEVVPETVLNAVREGISVVDRELRIIWANEVVRQQGPSGAALVGEPCYRFFHGRSQPCLGCEAMETFATARQSKRVHQNLDGNYWESVSSPVFNELGEVVQVVLVTRDVSERVFLESKIESIYQAGNHLAGLDWARVSRMSLDERIEHIRRNIVSHTEQLLKMDSLLIRQLDERTGELKPIIYVGHSPEEEEVIRRAKVLSQREGYGITGYVAATGHSYLCRDASTDPLIREHTTEFGSQVTVPLRLNDRVVGTMALRSAKPWAYSVEDMKFLEIFANFVAMALNTANLIELEHAVTHGRIAERIAHEIANPINAITNDVYLLLQEYIGHDSNTIAKLKDIEHNVDRVKEVVAHITDEGRPSAPVQRRTEDPVLKGRRILVADDDDAIRETMSDVLAKDGCIVETAADGLEAVEMIDARETYDLILSDIKMPKKDGYEIYSHIRDRFPDMPVILMTAFGYDPSHSIVRAREKGLEVVLFKPFKVTALRKAIRDALLAGGEAAETEG
ncbi:MAG TPA: response regulator [Planctomycetota bacterium]|nr:response regulator [Planctomycetota bacterium]